MLITREVNLACWCLPWWVDRTQRGSTTRSSTSAVQPWEMQGNIKIGKVGRGTFIENLHSAKWRENCIFFMWCCIWTFSPYLMKLCHSDHAVLLPEPINEATACFCAPPATQALDRSRRKHAHAAFAIAQRLDLRLGQLLLCRPRKRTDEEATSYDTNQTVLNLHANK